MRPLPLTLAMLTATATLTTPTLPAQAATPAIQITRVYYDSPGVDRRSNTSLNAEYVTILNTTRRAVDLEGWTLRDKTGYTYSFGSDVILGAHKKITVRTGRGQDGTTSLHWGRGAYVWNNDKDTAYIRNPAGRLIDSCSYNNTRVDYKNCL